ncbi:MAG: ferritin [Anaerolineales bacterium]
MLISEKIVPSMNKQIGSELLASNQYLNIASYFDLQSLPELAGFFFRQSDEERMHALKFVHFLLDADAAVAIPAIEAAATDITSAEQAVEKALAWEKQVTKQINDLMDLAQSENDHASQQFLRWFVDEQVEEVSTMDELLAIVRHAGDSPLLIEQYLARRGDPHGGEEA